VTGQPEGRQEMSEQYVVCAPTHAEARRLRRGLDAGIVRRTGVGRSRSEQAARSAELGTAAGIAVAGIAGGLSPELRPGDVVVATEVRGSGEESAVACPSAPLLAGALARTDALQRAGSTVHIGPVVSADHLVTGSSRAELRATVALAVDMESAWLLAQPTNGSPPANGRHELRPQGGATVPSPAACVRVIADPADERLLRATTLAHLRTALRTLGLVVPALNAWGSALRTSRRVLLASPRSFCA
jgi:4-hydroxy-3-methylbut-2-enyl diphosphate reductase